MRANKLSLPSPIFSKTHYCRGIRKITTNNNHNNAKCSTRILRLK
ncbi:hypothetical protein T01_10622 [Trichinella spiralis]|uniref:Uncharacterized protein n=1 Tax=Trichinella spiralis TaxID=6334 RepID=A0A0V0Z1M6_TRISP|nr:hypothetical protein T01_10622 [Trichinella spiralis]